jgi:deoxyribonuclease V
MGWERVRHSEIPRGFSVERARYAQALLEPMFAEPPV